MEKMTIGPNCWVVLEYTLFDESGAVVAASDSADGEPIAYVHGYGMIVPGLERGVTGLCAGDRKDVVVEPAEAFGDRDEELVVEVSHDELPKPGVVSVGDDLVAESADGEEAMMRVVEVRDDAVVLDGNHPLAGQTLCYRVFIREVRMASEDEIRHAAEDFESAQSEHEPAPTDDEGAPLFQLEFGLRKKPNLPN